MILSVIRNHYLLGVLIRKDIKSRYQGSVLGMIWTWIVPILMLLVYTFVFSVVFQARWGQSDDKFEFALVMFCGLSTFNVLSDVMNRSVRLMGSHSNYVKKVVFPLEILPVSITGSSMFFACINFVILVVANLIIHRFISPAIWQAPLVLLPLGVLCVGVGLLLSAVSVFLKDIGNVISVIIMILMYMSPVFYSLSGVPERFRLVMRFNPIAHIIENMRSVILYGTSMDIAGYLFSCIAAVMLFFVGNVVFNRLRDGFADVL